MIHFVESSRGLFDAYLAIAPKLSSRNAVPSAFGYLAKDIMCLVVHVVEPIHRVHLVVHLMRKSRGNFQLLLHRQRNRQAGRSSSSVTIRNRWA
jgi:hypothetical protein